MNKTKYIGIAFAIAIAAAIPLLASAQVVSTSTLEQELATFLSEITQLQQEGATTTISAPATTQMTTQTTPATSANPPICPIFSDTLSLGSSGAGVVVLQQFLAQNPLIYPEGSMTGYFGALTQAALERWQTAYGIVTSGTPNTTGFGVLGPHTRAAIAASCNGTTNSSAVSNQQPLCPIAAQPATPCPGTWSPITNATGCTTAWQCSVPLSSTGATTSTSVVSSSVAATSTSVSSVPAACVPYTLPLCQGGTTQWLGMSNGCNLGYQCLSSGQ